MGAVYPRDEAYLENVIPRRIALFESIQNQQRLHLLSLSPDPIRIELPNETVKEGKKWNTTPLDIAKEISKSLGSNALIAKVNGVLWDLSRPLESDCTLELFTFDSDEGRDTFWHSSAHILGESLERKYGCKLCIGPCTTRGEGFYYDAFYGDLGLNEDHFKGIETEAANAVSEKQPFERIEVSRQQALDMFSDNRFKVEIIRDLPEDKTITVYRCGPLVDLCRGPHIPNTSFVKALACTKASSAYWRGDKDRESLQRVYGISFPDQKRLKEYLKLLEEAKKYDHRELTKKQELFFFHPLSPGSCFFLPHGARVCNKLLEFIRSQYWKRGYEEVWSPNMYNMQLWETSGHAANYKENMFVFEVEKQEFALKPMNCPGHCLMFDHRVRSYRELPLRLADFGVLHRNEASGALTGLTRVRRFQQDDAHIFCRESQIKDEVKGVLEFISYVYKIFGFTFDLKLSTRPEKYLGDVETWVKAEAALSEALNEHGKTWEINEGDGAFYGPKIDISVSDAMKRKFQCATLQLDFQLPQRFNLSYSAEDESKRERPVMIHRAILGSVERMFAILLEHFKGKWPFWLSPRQAMVCPVSDKSQSYALKLQEQIHDAGYYVDVDTSDRTIQKKVREAQVAQYNYILVVGEAEASSGQVLLVENDDSTRHIVTALLRNCKYEVIQAANGLEAWKILETHTNQIDLVLSEVVMPCLSGIGLLCKIMSHNRHKNIPVILISHDSIGLVFKCLSKGAADFLVNLIRKNELKNLWQHVWRRCQSSSGNGSGSGTQIQKSIKSKSSEQSGNNSGSYDGEDNQGNAPLRNVSDDGSGTQSSWTKQAVQVDSSQAVSPCDQAPEHGGSSSEQVICSNVETSSQKEAQMTPSIDCQEPDNTGKGKSFISNSLRDPELEPKNAIELPVEHLDSRHKSALEIDPNASSLKMDIKKENQIGNCPLSEHHVATVGVSHPQMDKRELKKVVDASELDNTSSNDSKLCVVELSLKRLRGLGESGITSQDDRNVLRRSELSAFSRYNSSSNLTRTPNEITRSSSLIENNLEMAKNNPVHDVEAQMSKNLLPESSHYVVIQHPHQQRNHHEFNHDNLSLKKLGVDGPHCASSNILAGSCEGRSASGSNHGSNGQNASSNAENAGGTNENNDTVLASTSRSGGDASSCGSGNTKDSFKLVRAAALTKFRQKRKERCFEKKVRYQNRKKLAEKRPRVRGQFVRQIVQNNTTNTADE